MRSEGREATHLQPFGLPRSGRGRIHRSRTRRAAFTGADVPPLHWWRHLPADAFTGMHLQRLRRAMSGIGMVGEPRWPDAVRGYPAAAVAVALKTFAQPDVLEPIVDLTASTLLIPAIAGDAAAIRLLADMIRRHPDVPDTAVGRSWRTRLVGRRTTRPTPRKIVER